MPRVCINIPIGVHGKGKLLPKCENLGSRHSCLCSKACASRKRHRQECLCGLLSPLTTVH